MPRDARGARDLRAFWPVTPAAVTRGCVLADIDIVNYTIPTWFDATRRCPRGLHKRPAGCPSTARGSSRRVTGRERRERVALLTGGARSVRVENRCRAENTCRNTWLGMIFLILDSNPCLLIRKYETIKSNRERLQRALRVSLNRVTFALQRKSTDQSGLINSSQVKEDRRVPPHWPTHGRGGHTRANVEPHPPPFSEPGAQSHAEPAPRSHETERWN